MSDDDLNEKRTTKTATFNPTIKEALDEMLQKLADSPHEYSYVELMSALVGEGARMAAFDEMPIETFLDGAKEIAMFEYSRGITKTEAARVRQAQKAGSQ